MKKNPSIRFKGFTDAWEQRKLEEDISVVGGATPSKSNPDYWNGPIVWLSSQEIKEKYVSQGTYTITKKAVDDNTTKMVKAGTPLIVSRSGILARLFPISIPTTDVAINQDIKALIFDLNIINTNFFVAQLQKNEDFILRSIVKTGTTVQSINMPDFYKLQLSFPSMNEQEKVGKFFQRLDDTIALHQQQLNKFKKMKKAMLQKMFPQNGEKFPEIRFNGFTKEWEERKLIDVAEIYDNLRVPVTASDRIKGNIPYYGANGIQDYVQGFTHDGEFILIAEDGANDLVDYPVNYVNGRVWVNNHAHVVSGKKEYLDNLFLASRIKSMNISMWLVGGGRAKLNGDVLKKIPLSLPSFVEQVTIGNFFQKLDENINLQQKKISHYQNVKKVLLQQMFVQ